MDGHLPTSQQLTRTAVVDLTLAVGRLHIAVGQAVAGLVAARLAMDARAAGDANQLEHADQAMKGALRLASEALDQSWQQLEDLLEQLGKHPDA